ncbi:ATP-dependent helicase [Agrobacterium tumefaciens]|nr:ATP-dependent helicase [Agrobacterium tumefaciens]
MAELLHEEVGQTVGYRMRLDNRISSKTRIEVVTEGVFARMVLDDPELAGVSTVIFDEFHERSLDGDFGLALALDVQSGLRDDLRILVMSATLDVERISALMADAPVIQSLGRTFPIDVRYEDRWQGVPVEEKVTKAITEAHGSETGSILAFLPGQAEITRTAARLEGRFPSDTDIIPLYGNLSQKEQDAAIKPAPAGRRKIVLATSIAETSITIDGVRVVIDSGLQRLPVFEPATGITRLETVRVSRASADQRAGAPGERNPVLRSACGIKDRRRRSMPLRHRKFWRAISPALRSISPIGGFRTRLLLLFLICPPKPHLKNRWRFSKIWARSTKAAH